MNRLLIHVEGQTEEAFVNNVLASHLLEIGYTSVSAKIIGSPRNQGGICAWPLARRGLISDLRNDPGIIVTTMVDYYGLPTSDQKAWPGRIATTKVPHAEKALSVERALLADIQHEVGDSYDLRRFIPFVMMHEYEGILFSNCAKFAEAIGQPILAPQLQAVRDGFDTPEEINDSSLTAPSKRILAILPEYTKPLYGVIAAIDIGLDAIRRECPHFREWLEHLESLPNSVP